VLEQFKFVSKKNLVLEKRIDDLETYSRHSCILLHEVPEFPQEYTIKVVVDTLPKKKFLPLTPETRLDVS